MANQTKRVTEADYAYAVARIRSNELKLLTRQDVDAMIAGGDSARCVGRLGEKGWGDGSQTRDESAMLEKEIEKTWSLVEEVAPDMSVFDFMKIPNDFHNLKAALKGRLSHSEWRQLCLYPCTVPVDTIARAVDEKLFELLPDFMREPAQEAYDALVTWVDGQLCEILLDAAAIEATIAAAERQGGLALELARLDAFAADVRIAVRSARMKKPYNSVKQAMAACPPLDVHALSEAAAAGEEEVREYLGDIDRDAADALKEGLPAFERLIAARTQALLDRHKYDTLGVAPLISYIKRRESEVRTARVVIAGLRNGVSEERIRALI